MKKLNVEPDIAVTGGGAKNIGLVKALGSKFGRELLVPPEPLITGALGAALMGKDIYEKYAAEGQKPSRSANKAGRSDILQMR